MARQVKLFSKAALRRPLPPDRPLNTPQYNLTFGRRRKGKDEPKDIRKLQNGKRLKDIVRRLQAHQSANLADFIRHRADYVIAAACHCPKSQHIEDWLPRWAADNLHVPGFPDMDAKMAVAIEVARQDRENRGSAAYEPELDRLSAEEIAELLPTTFDDRQACGRSGRAI